MIHVRITWLRNNCVYCVHMYCVVKVVTSAADAYLYSVHYLESNSRAGWHLETLV